MVYVSKYLFRERNCLMQEETAKDRGNGRITPASTYYAIVRRQETELPVEDKWPRGRRLLVIMAGTLVLWLAIVGFIRWV
jgi:hypothetical protein